MSMIASVLHLNRQSVKALKITDAYSIHRVVYSLYEDVRQADQKNASDASGILYADQGGDLRGRKILLLSNRYPKETLDGLDGEVQSKPVPEKFLDTNLFRFNVIINPTRRDSKSRKLIPIRGREAIADWFHSKAGSKWGFEIVNDSLQIDKIEVLRFKDKQKRTATIAQAHLQGVLRKTDHDLFTQSFCKGIGRGRAFGCGLLRIAPILETLF